MKMRKKPQRPVGSRSVLRVEDLERRDAPATLLGNNTVTYQDFDGDTVTVTFSQPILTAANVNAVFTFDTGTVNGSNATKQQLQEIDLAVIGAPAGTNISVLAVASPVNGGDGFAAVGQIDATGLDLGTVTIDGDLGRILAGDATTKTSGLKGLTAQSMGRYDTSTGAPNLNTVIQGKLDFLKVKGDVKEAFIDVQGPIGSVSIGGSLLGGSSKNSGRIRSDGDMGSVTIGGNVTGLGGDDSGQVFCKGKLSGVRVGGSVRGGNGPQSGVIRSNGNMGQVHIAGSLIGGGGFGSGQVNSDAKLSGVRVDGSVLGGAGDDSGLIISSGEMGQVNIGGNLTGGGGDDSGAVISVGKLAGVKVGCSVQGGAGDNSGQIFTLGDMGSVTIGGDLTGGDGVDSGQVTSLGKLAGVRVGGSVHGGAGDFSGRIVSDGDMGSVTIGGDLIGGSASGKTSLQQSGFIRGQRIASITLGGSLVAGVDNTSGTFTNNGAIRADNDIGSVLIKGSIVGNSTNAAIISARGQATPTATSDIAIGSLQVLGRVEFAHILAGVDVAGAAKNADAQIGKVSVGGDWVASSIAAGAVPGADNLIGTLDDAKMSGVGVKDDAGISSKIGSVTIGGQALGTVGGTDHFGIVAENIGAVKIGGTPLVLTAGNGNDDIAVGITGDFRVNEI